MSGPILLLAMVGSVITLVGSVIFLFRQKTVVDSEGNVTEVDIPIFGKVKSNYPSIGMGMIGAALAVFTMMQLDPETKTIALSATVTLSDPSGSGTSPIFVGVVPQEYFLASTVSPNGTSVLSFEVDHDTSYQVVALKATDVTEDFTRYATVFGPAELEEGKLIFERDLK